ncbi:MAG: SGNH/GDSL hydrolase family protein [Terrisporobacter sp.]|uniref:SGNH/GDSL hydrolase family protein n=1 Tax=Terrisporobacter sp. TaxID=1965305 RepID=UPI002FC670C0
MATAYVMKRKAVSLALVFLVLCMGIYYELTLNKVSSVFCSTKEDVRLQDMYFNKWKDKSWISLGDSITKPGAYQNNLKDILGFSIIDNMGKSGQTMTSGLSHNSTYTLGKDIDYSKYDLATIFIGTNDFRYNKKLGEIKTSNSKDFDENTFTGSYQLLIESILKSNPNINLVLITPTQRIKDGYDINFTNKTGSKLVDYVSVIKDLGEMYSLSVLDLYSEGGITKENISSFTNDGLHLNDEGYKRISEKMYRFLLNI